MLTIICASPIVIFKEISVNTLENRLAKIGIAMPHILLPRQDIDLKTWAVIACDQYTQDEAYWESVYQNIANKASTGHFIFPEIHLEKPGKAERIQKIHQEMQKALASDTFDSEFKGFVYLERQTAYQKNRRGLVVAVDLEAYDWQPQARPLIRASEGTVTDRLPPRMDIRRKAGLESPHIILLIDDEEDLLFSAISSRCTQQPPAYQGKLMGNAGSLAGWKITDAQEHQAIASAFEKLAEKAKTRYGTADPSPFLFAVGDGNHSLATAKAIWDEFKTENKDMPHLLEHPARYALVEIENIYDPAIQFEPIHRALFNINMAELIKALARLPVLSTEQIESPQKLAKLLAEGDGGPIRYGVVAGQTAFLLNTGLTGLATEPLQPILDAFVAAKAERTIDYLHGSEETIEVAQRPNTAGILLPPIGKSDLFMTVAKTGPLPRKSFSMGEAIEKRFYLECRKLF